MRPASKTFRPQHVARPSERMAQVWNPPALRNLKTSPPLTGLQAPSEQLAHEAAMLLADQIERRQSTDPRKILLQEMLVVRASTGPAPRSNM